MDHLADDTEPTLVREHHHLSFAELEAFITVRYGPDPELQFISHELNDGRMQTDGRIATLVGVDRMTVYRWREVGVLSVGQADRAATGLGPHPSAIWGEVWCSDIDPDSVPSDEEWMDARRHHRNALARAGRERHTQQRRIDTP